MQVLRYEVQNGTTLNYKWRDVSEKFKFTNTAFNFEIGYKPADFNNADKSLQLKHSTEFEPSSGKLSHTEAFKFGLTKVGPLGLWLTVSILGFSIYTQLL